MAAICKARNTVWGTKRVLCKGGKLTTGRKKVWCPVADCNKAVLDLGQHLRSNVHKLKNGSVEYKIHLKNAIRYMGLSEARVLVTDYDVESHQSLEEVEIMPPTPSKEKKEKKETTDGEEGETSEEETSAESTSESLEEGDGESGEEEDVVVEAAGVCTPSEDSNDPEDDPTFSPKKLSETYIAKDGTQRSLPSLAM